MIRFAAHSCTSLTIDLHMPRNGNYMQLRVQAGPCEVAIDLYDLPKELSARLIAALGEPRRVSLDGPVPHQIAAE
jgi:hypothetical protein